MTPCWWCGQPPHDQPTLDCASYIPDDDMTGAAYTKTVIGPYRW